MLSRTGIRIGCAAALAACMPFSVPYPSAPAVPTAAAEAGERPFADGEAGFVVSSIWWALGPDADKNTTCPDGMSLNVEETFAASAEGRRREGEADADYAARRRAATGYERNARPTCQFPDEYGPDPNFRTVAGSDIAVPGMDLDGGNPRSGASCAHQDFRGTDGQRGVDNQFYRLVGCSRGFQSTGGHITFGREMLTGSWGILIQLKGVDSLANDNDVEVGIHANADPIQLSPQRRALSHATYVIDADPRYQARTRGRIVNGVLTTDPVDARFHWVVNGMRVERPVELARLRLAFIGDGNLEGILAGYASVDKLYDFLVGYRTARDREGKPAAPRIISNSSAGSASSAGYSCNGVYHAMKQLADGNRDPVTGKCSSLSTQYRITAVPAFVVEPRAETNLAGRGK